MKRRNLLILLLFLFSFKLSAQIDASNIVLISEEGVRKTLLEFLRDSDNIFAVFPEAKMLDIDSDGKDELFVYQYTGGAHCCECVAMYKPKPKTKMEYQFVIDFCAKYGTLQLDDVGVGTNNALIKVSIFEEMGYFHTCYACFPEINVPVISNLYLMCDKAGIHYTSIPQLNDSIIESLSELKNIPIRNIDLNDLTDFDDGNRKCFAMNLMCYYFNNQQNEIATKQLFYQYYPDIPDRDTIWTEIISFCKEK